MLGGSGDCFVDVIVCGPSVCGLGMADVELGECWGGSLEMEGVECPSQERKTGERKQKFRKTNYILKFLLSGSSQEKKGWE